MLRLLCLGRQLDPKLPTPQDDKQNTRDQKHYATKRPHARPVMSAMTSLLQNRTAAGTANERCKTEERIPHANPAAEARLVLRENDVADGRKGDEDAGEEAKEDGDDNDSLHTERQLARTLQPCSRDRRDLPQDP